MSNELPKHILLDRFDPDSKYTPTPDEELDLLRTGTPRDLDFLVNDPSAPIDNRTAVRFFLALRNVGPSLTARLVAPYDNGFYKKSDGKSHPLWFLRLPRFLRVLRFRKDIVAVRHDFDYYRGLAGGPPSKDAVRYGSEERLKADELYKTGQMSIGLWRFAAWVEYCVLRLCGGLSWQAHHRLYKKNDKYGTVEHIPNLPDKD